jgi:hypothetical protein
MPRHAEPIKMDKCPGLWGFQKFRTLPNSIQNKMQYYCLYKKTEPFQIQISYNVL